MYIHIYVQHKYIIYYSVYISNNLELKGHFSTYMLK